MSICKRTLVAFGMPRVCLRLILIDVADQNWKNSVRHSLSINPLFKRVEPIESGACGGKRKATAGLWTMRHFGEVPKPASNKRKSEWLPPRAKVEKINCAIDDWDVAEMLMALAAGSHARVAQVGVSVR